VDSLMARDHWLEAYATAAIKPHKKRA